MGSKKQGLALKTADGMKGLALQIEPEALAILASVSHFLKERQIESYLVGGFVRDVLIGRSTADIDIAIAADVLTTGPDMADALGGKYVLLDEANRIARVVLSPASSGKSPWHIDLSTLAGDLRKDLARRDFTIDAMAIDLNLLVENPSSIVLIDPLGGQKDLQKGIIKTVTDAAFESDPARLLRAVRLAAELGFVISSETEALVRRHNQLVARVSGERVREELLRIFMTPEAGDFVRYLDKTGLLTVIIPELEPSKGVEQPVEHHWDVFNHSLETVRAVGFLLRQSDWTYTSREVIEDVPWSEKLSRHFASEVSNGSNRAALLKLAALLHDIAKPETKIIANQRVRFLGHNEQGAEAVVGILERLRFSNREIKLVELMVRYHMRPTQMAHEGLPTSRAIYRYFRDTGSAGTDILFLSLADHLAARGPDLDLEQWKWHTGQVKYILTECSRRESIVTPPRLIDGHDIINIFRLKPGPEIRRILESVREAQAAGELNSREDALSYVRNRLLYKEQKLEE